MILSNNKPSLNLYSQSKTLAICLFLFLGPISLILADQSGTMQTAYEVAGGKSASTRGYFNKADYDNGGTYSVKCVFSVSASTQYYLWYRTDVGASAGSVTLWPTSYRLDGDVTSNVSIMTISSARSWTSIHFES